MAPGHCFRSAPPRCLARHPEHIAGAVLGRSGGLGAAGLAVPGALPPLSECSAASSGTARSLSSFPAQQLRRVPCLGVIERSQRALRLITLAFSVLAAFSRLMRFLTLVGREGR